MLLIMESINTPIKNKLNIKSILIYPQLLIDLIQFGVKRIKMKMLNFIKQLNMLIMNSFLKSNQYICNYINHFFIEDGILEEFM